MTSYETNPLLRKPKKLYGYLIVVLTIVLTVAGYFLYIWLQPGLIPKSIQSDVKFVILYPEPSRQTVFNRSSFKYNKSIGQLSYVVAYDNNNITFAEQTTPEAFSASSTFFEGFIQKLDSYATFSSVDGQVGLTIPPQINQETAVMNAKGTLVFASASGKISQSNWTQLFNTMQFIQPK